MAVKVITPPDEEPLTVEEVKSFLHGIDYDDQDVNIAAFITSARRKIEKRCGRCVAQHELELTVAEFNGEICLPMPPVRSIVSVSYIDTDGNTQTLDAANYELFEDDLVPFIFPLVDWPTNVADRPDAVKVRYMSGDEPDDVPEDIKQAIRLLVGSAFELREDVLLTPVRQELQITPNGYSELIAPYIVPRL